MLIWLFSDDKGGVLKDVDWPGEVGQEILHDEATIDKDDWGLNSQDRGGSIEGGFIEQDSHQSKSAEAALEKAIRAIESGDGSALYQLLSGDLRQLFDEHSVLNGLKNADTVSWRLVGNVTAEESGFARQTVLGTGEAGQEYSYEAVMRLEGEEWKLYGTREVGH